MRLGFDCAKLVKGTSNSIGIYNVTKYIVTRLATRVPKDVQIVVIGNESNREDFDVNGIEFVPVNLNVNSRKEILLWELFRVNSYIKRLNIDEIFFPRGFTSLFCPAKDVVMIHDLIPFYYNKYHKGELGRLQNRYVMMRMKSSIKSADKIVTISEYSKSDIVKLVPKADKKTKVILHGFESNNRPNLVNPNKPYDYFIGITSKLPHKNVKGILEAYIKYFNSTANPYDLEIVGVNKLEFVENKYGITLPENVKSHVHFNRFLSDDEFYSLFKYSKGLVFLSKIEGFGLPPLEAMELSVPAISSNTSSLPEVVREGGILVDPDDSDEVALAMKKITEDNTFAETLVAKGKNNLTNFSWDDRIKEYMDFLL